MPQWSRLIRFIAAEDGKAYSGEPQVPLNEDVAARFAEGSKGAIKVNVLPRDDPLDASLSPSSTEVRTVKKLLPLLDPKAIPSIRALGANFVQPGQVEAEAKSKRPPIPILFFKPPLTTVIGHGDAIRLPRELADQTDYEVELVVIIGTECKDVKREDALKYVLGYGIANDVSARKRMFAVGQWGLGKTADTYFPLGSTIVSKGRRSSLGDIADDLSQPPQVSSQVLTNPEEVTLRTVLNGKEMQHGHTSQMLYGVAETIEWLSQGSTLHPGTIMSMGTPPGEGFKRDPPVFFKHKDECTISASHGIGSLSNPVVDESKELKTPKARL